jgi:integrase
LANIQRRGEGQWRVQIRRKTEYGKALTKTKTFETYEAAKRWADVVEGRISGDEYTDKSKERRATLRQLVERYEREVSPNKKGHATEIYRLKAWANSEFAEWSLPTVDSVTVVDWMEKRAAEGKAPTTISNAVNLLSAVYRTAIAKWGYRVTNPCNGIPRPKQRPPRTAHLSAKQEKDLIKACSAGPSWLAWCARLAIETAMRAGEIRRLRWEHVHDSHIHLPETKNDLPRDVPLTSVALALVREMRRALPARIDGYVFGDPNIDTCEAGGFTKDALSVQFRKAASRANVPVTFHDLRHVATTRLVPLHDNVLELSATTGHKSLDMLKRYYNPDPAKRAAAIRAREKLRMNR